MADADRYQALDELIAARLAGTAPLAVGADPDLTERALAAAQLTAAWDAAAPVDADAVWARLERAIPAASGPPPERPWNAMLRRLRHPAATGWWQASPRPPSWWRCS